jgi:hypothetical protein
MSETTNAFEWGSDVPATDTTNLSEYELSQLRARNRAIPELELEPAGFLNITSLSRLRQEPRQVTERLVRSGVIKVHGFIAGQPIFLDPRGGPLFRTIQRPGNVNKRSWEN